ncbi:MAG: tetratricopeptide repeat protein [Bacillota bacterium]
MKKILTVLILIFVLFNAQIVLGNSKYQEEWQNVVEVRKDKLENHPEDYTAKYELAVAYSNLGEIEKATKSFKGLKEVENRDQKLNDLITYYQNKVDQENTGIKEINFLAFAHYTADNYKQARKLLKEIVELDPKNIWSYNYLAVTHHELKDYNQAKNTLEKSLDIEENEYTHFLLGVNYYKQGNLFKAFYYVNKGRKAADLFLDD